MPIDAPPLFLRALDSLKDHSFRPELHVTQIPPPTRIAPWAVALSCEVNSSPEDDPEAYIGHSQFVFLYDPEGQRAWDGTMRIVAFVRAPLDSEMSIDPLLGEVAWSRLPESLTISHAPYHQLTGTVTRSFNDTFTDSVLTLASSSVEVRASWSPRTEDLSPHLRAWAQWTESVCGLPPRIHALA